MPWPQLQFRGRRHYTQGTQTYPALPALRLIRSLPTSSHLQNLPRPLPMPANASQCHCQCLFVRPAHLAYCYAPGAVAVVLGLFRGPPIFYIVAVRIHLPSIWHMNVPENQNRHAAGQHGRLAHSLARGLVDYAKEGDSTAAAAAAAGLFPGISATACWHCTHNQTRPHGCPDAAYSCA